MEAKSPAYGQGVGIASNALQKLRGSEPGVVVLVGTVAYVDQRVGVLCGSVRHSFGRTPDAFVEMGNGPLCGVSW